MEDAQYYLAIDAVYPDYLQHFHCLGAACRDNCCCDWTVFVDRESYPVYARALAALGREDRMALFQEGRSSDRYARLLGDGEGNCPLLTAEGLCTLHRDWGPEALCVVCSIYPRSYYAVNEQYFAAVNLSCIEVSRLALRNPDGIRLLSGRLTLPAKTEMPHIRSRGAPQGLHIVEHFLPLQEKALALLQNRAYPLEQRLLLLGLFALAVEQGRCTTPAQMEAFGGGAQEQGELQELMALPGAGPTQLKLSLKLSQLSVSRSGTASNRAYIHYQGAAVAKYREGARSDRDLLDNYRARGLRPYRKFCQTHGYVLENYLVNSLLEHGFPLYLRGLEISVFGCFCFLVSEYVALRSVLAAHLEPQPQEDMLLDIIQKHAKMMMHNTTIAADCLALLQQEQLYSLRGTALLLNIHTEED